MKSECLVCSIVKPGKESQWFRQLAFSLIVYGLLTITSLVAGPMEKISRDNKLDALTNEKKIDFITVLSSEASVDWSAGACDQSLIVEKASDKPIVNKCMQTEAGLYIQDSKDKTIKIDNFVLFTVLNLGSGKALYLYSDSLASRLIIELDKRLGFKSFYVLDNEPLMSKPKASVLYPQILMWHSYELIKDNPCVLDFINASGHEASSFSYLHPQIPMQIKVISVGNVSLQKVRTSVLSQIESALTAAIQLARKEDAENEDFSERVFVFLITNSPDKEAFKYLLAKYKRYLNNKTITQYKTINSCKSFT